MEDNFRNALIIISAVVITAIFIHGVWTIRKNKNPYKLKTKHEKIDPINREFDRKGFDQDGVGEVKVVKASTKDDFEYSDIKEDISHEVTSAPLADEDAPSSNDIEQPGSAVEASLEPIEPIINELPELELEEQAPAVSQENTVNAVYEEPVTQAKPQSQINASKSKAQAKKEHLKRNQFELDFDEADQVETNEPTINQPEPVENEVLVLSVVMTEGHLMSGAALLPSLLTLGMKYGEMNIFHRHEDNAGNGKITFSLANMMNPGTFDLDNMENFASQGVSLFMTLPNAGEPFEIFDQMLASAKQLAQEFHGQVMDDKRSVMTKQTEQHYVSRIREFERKSRIANAQ